MRILLAMTLVLGLAVGAGCSDSKCETTFNRLCARAAACPTTDGKVRLIQTGFSFSFDSKSDCQQLYATFGCMADSADTIDFDSCKRDIEAATCVAAAGTEKGGFTYPLTCNAPRPADGGP